MEEPHHEPQRLHTGQVRTLVMPLHALRQTIHLALCTLETLQKPTSLLYAGTSTSFRMHCALCDLFRSTATLFLPKLVISWRLLFLPTT